MEQQHEPEHLLRNGGVRGLVLSQFAAMVGTFALYFVSMALVEQITRSSAQVGLMIFSSTLPGFVFGLIAGPYVDRHDRITVIKWGCFLRILIGVGFAFAIYILPGSTGLIWAIYVGNFLISALAQFVSAAEASVIPMFVTREQLMGANSLFNLSSITSQGVGVVVVAPALLKVGGPGLVGLAAVIIYTLSWLTVVRLPHLESDLDVHAPTVGNVLRSTFIELREGWAFIVKDRFVALAVSQTVLAATALLAVFTLAPGFAYRILGTDVADIAFAAVPVGVGFLGGLWLISSPHGLKMSRQAWPALGLSLYGGGLLGIAILSMLKGLHLAGLVLMVIMAGFGFAFTVIPARTILQERPAPHMRGRVISTQLVLTNAASTVPMPLAGGLADLWGIQQVMLVISGIILFVAAISVYIVRTGHTERRGTEAAKREG